MMGRVTTLAVDRNGLYVLSEEACFALLASQWFGRVGVSVGALPAILPVAYGLDDRSIVFRTVAGSKLDAIGHGQVICFQVDQAERDTHDGWSVQVIGQATEVVDPVECSRLATLRIDPWPSLDADRFVRLPATIVSGRAIGNPPDDSILRRQTSR
jgi:uncharacterized protein